MDQIKALKDLLDGGFMSPNEYEQRRSQIIDQMTSTFHKPSRDSNYRNDMPNDHEMFFMDDNMDYGDWNPMVDFSNDICVSPASTQQEKPDLILGSSCENEINPTRSFHETCVGSSRKSSYLSMEEKRQIIDIIATLNPADLEAINKIIDKKPDLNESDDFSCDHSSVINYLNYVDDETYLTLRNHLSDKLNSNPLRTNSNGGMNNIVSDTWNLSDVSDYYLPPSNPQDDFPAGMETNHWISDEIDYDQWVMNDEMDLPINSLSDNNFVTGFPGLSSSSEQIVPIKTEPGLEVGKATEAAKPPESKKKMRIKVEVYKVEKSGDGPKPWICDSPGCQKAFCDSSNLIKHIRTHTQEKPYECTQCEKKFSHKSSLREHGNVHTGKKPFSCEQCGKSFGQNSNLTRHIRLHTGEKPFVCSFCNRGFTQSTNLKSHVLKIHSKNKSQPSQTNVKKAPKTKKKL